MATLTVQDASNGLAAVSFTAADAGGDDVAAGVRASGWDIGVVLLINNGSAGAVTVSADGLDDVIVTAGEIGAMPLYSGVYGATKTVTYSAVTSVTVAAVQTSPA